MISIPDLFKKSWAVYKEGFWFFAKLMGFHLALCLLLVPGFLMLLLGAGLESQMVFLVGVLVLLVALLPVIYIGLCLHLSLFLSIREHNFTITVKEYFQKAKPLVWPFVWVSLLAGLAALAGFMLFIIPGIIFAVWFAFAKFAAALDQKRGMDALNYSKQLVKGHFWPVLGRIGLLVAISMALSSLPGSIGFLVGMFFITPFATIYLYTLYEDLKSHNLPTVA